MLTDMWVLGAELQPVDQECHWAAWAAAVWPSAVAELDRDWEWCICAAAEIWADAAPAAVHPLYWYA